MSGANLSKNRVLKFEKNPEAKRREPPRAYQDLSARPFHRPFNSCLLPLPPRPPTLIVAPRLDPSRLPGHFRIRNCLSLDHQLRVFFFSSISHAVARDSRRQGYKASRDRCLDFRSPVFSYRTFTSFLCAAARTRSETTRKNRNSRQVDNVHRTWEETLDPYLVFVGTASLRDIVFFNGDWLLEWMERGEDLGGSGRVERASKRPLFFQHFLPYPVR